MSSERKPGPAGSPEKKKASNDYLGALAIIVGACAALWLLGSTIEAVQTFINSNITPAMNAALDAFVSFLTQLGKGELPAIAGLFILLGGVAAGIAIVKAFGKK